MTRSSKIRRKEGKIAGFWFHLSKMALLTYSVGIIFSICLKKFIAARIKKSHPLKWTRIASLAI
jgi:hypothetical protein